MRATIATLALAGAVAAAPQAVTQAITPPTTAAAGCLDTFPGTFEIQVVNTTTSSRKRDTVLTLTLNGGILKDQEGRTGYIAANQQFQFDGPPQAGAIYTAGWAVCGDNNLSLGSQTVFWQCLSGTFYNLYAKSTGAQCSPVNIEAINASGGATTGAVSQQSDGQPTETPVTQISDGQPQGPTGVPVTQLSDGQPQGPTGVPVTQISDGQPQGPTGVPVTQISDGQPQGPTGVPVTQISDGQPQGPTGVPVTQISDGQPQGPTGVPVTQISDGQPQATTAPPYVAAAGRVETGAFGLVAGLLAVIAL